MNLGFIKGSEHHLPALVHHAMGSGIGYKHLMGSGHYAKHLNMRLMAHLAARHPHHHEHRHEHRHEHGKGEDNKDDEMGEGMHRRHHKRAEPKQDGGVVSRGKKAPKRPSNGRSINQLLAEALR